MSTNVDRVRELEEAISAVRREEKLRDALRVSCWEAYGDISRSAVGFLVAGQLGRARDTARVAWQWRELWELCAYQD